MDESRNFIKWINNSKLSDSIITFPGCWSKLEKEKILITNAKYNTLLHKYEKEKAEWLEQLNTAERIISQQSVELADQKYHRNNTYQ